MCCDSGLFGFVSVIPSECEHSQVDSRKGEFSFRSELSLDENCVFRILKDHSFFRGL